MKYWWPEEVGGLPKTGHPWERHAEIELVSGILQRDAEEKGGAPKRGITHHFFPDYFGQKANTFSLLCIYTEICVIIVLGQN